MSSTRLFLLCFCLCLAAIAATATLTEQQHQRYADRIHHLNDALAFIKRWYREDLPEHMQEEFMTMVEQSGLAQVVKFQDPSSLDDDDDDDDDIEDDARAPMTYRPVVQMHGMGDYANNPFGMVPLKKFISKTLGGTYVTNIALGNTTSSDMLNTFFMSMDHEVDTFAAAVRADVNLAAGFNAIGYSQGNLIIRGYIERYNNPPVINWISVHGPLAGVAGVPQCNLTSQFCQTVSVLLGDIAYSALVQSILAQANYYREPLRIPEYLAGDQFLVEINNERSANNATYVSNFESVNKTALVKALADTMVWPNESEWFGFFEDGSLNVTLNMRDTTWYLQNTFGLQTADVKGALDFYTTPGNHLQFTNQFIADMVTQYFTN